MELAEAWKKAVSEPSDVVEHLPTLEQAVTDLDAQKVIELGVRSGVSTVAFLHALQGTGGELWSVDLQPPPDWWPGWHFVQGDSISSETLQHLPAQADLVFIDTSHAYLHTYRELCLYWPRVRSGGRLFLHDTEVEAPELIGKQPPYPVKKAATEFAVEHGLVFENEPNCYGLGCLAENVKRETS